MKKETRRVYHTTQTSKVIGVEEHQNGDLALLPWRKHEAMGAVVDLARQYMDLEQFDDLGEYKIVRGLEKALKELDNA